MRENTQVWLQWYLKSGCVSLKNKTNIYSKRDQILNSKSSDKSIRKNIKTLIGMWERAQKDHCL